MVSNQIRASLLICAALAFLTAAIHGGESSEIGIFTAAGAADTAPTKPEKPAPKPAAEGAVTRDEFEQLKKENEELRRMILEANGKSTDEKKPSSEVEYLRRENKKLKQKVDPTVI